MSDAKKKFENFKDKVEGEAKETVGKATGNQELELKGKLKKKKVKAKEKAAGLKDDLLEKINDKLDESEKSEKKKK